MAQRILPYVIGGDKIAVIAGKADNTFPTKEEIEAQTSIRIEMFVNTLPNFFPTPETLERQVLGTQQALKSEGSTPAIDGTMDVYWDDDSATMYKFMLAEMVAENGCFGIVRYEQALKRTCYCRCTIRSTLPNLDGSGGDDAIVPLELYNVDEAISVDGDSFATVTTP